MIVFLEKGLQEHVTWTEIDVLIDDRIWMIIEE